MEIVSSIIIITREMRSKLRKDEVDFQSSCLVDLSDKRLHLRISTKKQNVQNSSKLCLDEALV